MVRTFALIAINMTVAVVMAASIMPVAIVMAPVVREMPGVGYSVFAFAVAVFAGTNVMLWRLWKRV